METILIQNVGQVSIKFNGSMHYGIHISSEQYIGGFAAIVTHAAWENYAKNYNKMLTPRKLYEGYNLELHFHQGQVIAMRIYPHDVAE